MHDSKLCGIHFLRKTFNSLFTLSLLCFGLACSTVPKSEPIPRQSTEPRTAEGYQVDFLGLERHLGMALSKDTLGYFERSFNTCTVGFGYPNARNCQENHFVVINYQLLCRQSQGTVSETIDSSSLPAVRNKSGRWAIQNQSGAVLTDSEGRGQIKGIFPRSQRSQRLKLTIEGDFLYARAGELKRVLTPTSWCH